MRAISFLTIAAAIFFNGIPVWGESQCLSHYKKLGEESIHEIPGAISRAFEGKSETITRNGYALRASKKGRCSVDIRIEDSEKSLVCSETVTTCTDDLSPEEANRLREKNEIEERERQEQLKLLLQWEEKEKAWRKENERVLEEEKKQLLSDVPEEYRKNPEQYLPGLCNEYRIELRKVRSCQYDLDCGQVLRGTSCGCTRDFVARKNADVSRFYDLKKIVSALFSVSTTIPTECSDVAVFSTCDCPPTDGFACSNNVCIWRYISPVIEP